MDKKFRLREATREEVPVVLSYIKKLAEYEKLSHRVFATVESLDHWLFERNIGKVLFPEEDGNIVGFVIYFYNFSTFEGKAGIYLEDVYIDEEARGRGYGKKIFEHIAETALKEGCSRIEFVCLDWNENSINFYKKLGAFPMSDWSTYRIENDKIEELARM